MPKVETENTEKEKWDKLDKYKCYICKEEFYFVKKEFEEKISETEFSDEPFATLPIFFNKGTCPFCKASKKQLIYIMTDEEIKAKKEEKENEKKAAKEKLEEDLEKLKEEEERIDKLHSSQLEEMCKEIFRDTMDYLKELEISLRKGEITIDRFENLLFDNAFNIMQRDTEIYNKRNKEISLILSNSFKVGFRDALLSFTTEVRRSLKSMEKAIDKVNDEIEYAKNNDMDKDNIQNLKDKKEEIKDIAKDDLKQDIKNAKDGNRGLGDDFIKNLRKELR